MKKPLIAVLFTLSSLLLAAPSASALLNINYDFTDTDYGSSDFTLNGDAFWANDTGSAQISGSGEPATRLRLTNNTADKLGSAWLNTSTIDATQDWTFSFAFQVTQEVPAGEGAEGMAFYIQKNGTSYLPLFPDFSGHDPDMGLVINLDLYQNDGDPYSDELEVWYNGTVISNGSNFQIGTAWPSDYIFNITASYDSETQALTVTCTTNNGSAHVFSQTINNVVLGDLTDATIGFGADTGPEYNPGSGTMWHGENHDVLSLSGSAVPEPSTYALGAGLLALACAWLRRRR